MESPGPGAGLCPELPAPGSPAVLAGELVSKTRSRGSKQGGGGLEVDGRELGRELGRGGAGAGEAARRARGAPPGGGSAGRDRDRARGGAERFHGSLAGGGRSD